MSGLSIISIKSKELQSDLGVNKTKSAKAKVQRMGLTLIDGEFVLKKEVEMWVAGRLGIHENKTDSLLTGSSFEDLNG